MAKPIEEQKERFKQLFDFPRTIDTGPQTFQRARLIAEIIDVKKHPEPVQLTHQDIDKRSK